MPAHAAVYHPGFGHGMAMNAGHGFLAHVAHMAFTALIYEAIFRILRHIPLWAIVIMAAAAIWFGYQHYKKRGTYTPNQW